MYEKNFYLHSMAKRRKIIRCKVRGQTGGGLKTHGGFSQHGFPRPKGSKSNFFNKVKDKRKSRYYSQLGVDRPTPNRRRVSGTSVKYT